MLGAVHCPFDAGPRQMTHYEIHERVYPTALYLKLVSEESLIDPS